jgi:serine/threonine-protein kinase HipA
LQFFQLAQLAFWLLAATDGHAKNYSIFLQRGDAYTMTPLYDVISVWPYIGDAPNQFRWRTAGLAMALRGKNAHYTLHTIQARHWHGLAMKNGGPAVWEAMQAMVSRVEPAIAAVQARLPASYPERTWERITAGMRAMKRQFESGLAAVG